MPETNELSWTECTQLMEALPGMPVEERGPVIERLLRNSSPGIRSQALRMGSTLFSDDQITAFLRDDADDVMRNAGLEMCKLRGNRGFNLAVNLLQDRDPDVILQAILVLDHMKDPRGYDFLRLVLNHPDPNIIHAAINAIGHIGDGRAVQDLLPFLERDHWLQMAAVNALGDLRSPESITALQPFINDLFLGPLVVEALSRIGGSKAFKVLSTHLVNNQATLDIEFHLGYCAHILEGLKRPAKPDPDFRALLAARLKDEFYSMRLPAARCLLALGPGPEDHAALAVLAEQGGGSAELPRCLDLRADLASSLLGDSGIMRKWGLMLCRMHPDLAPAAALAAVITDMTNQIAGGEPDQELLDILLETLSTVRSADLAIPMLRLFDLLAPESQAVLKPVIKHYRPLLAGHTEKLCPSRRTRIIVESILGADPVQLVEAIMSLDDDDRIHVLRQISDNAGVVGKIPWTRLFEASPDYVAVMAQAASLTGLPVLVGMLRGELVRHPSSEVITALGLVRDRESIPALLDALGNASPMVRAYVIESLGRIGGDDARAALRRLAESADLRDARLAFKALAQCNDPQDDAFFRGAAENSDWHIRLPALDVLGSRRTPENLAVVARMTSDPMQLIAQKAVAFLESPGERS